MATLKQLSIFLENKLGRLNHIMEIISEADIRIIAATVADTSEYGILRMVTTDTEKAYQVLKNHNISANMSEVIGLSTDSKAGSFVDKLKCFARENIGIEYMYCFSIKEKAFLILRVNDLEKAKEVVKNYKLDTYSNQDLINL